LERGDSPPTAAAAAAITASPATAEPDQQRQEHRQFGAQAAAARGLLVFPRLADALWVGLAGDVAERREASVEVDQVVLSRIVVEAVLAMRILSDRRGIPAAGIVGVDERIAVIVHAVRARGHLVRPDVAAVSPRSRYTSLVLGQ